ncbi:DUF2971 domain-containing protein [Serratia liquefaciens]|uniref:DUF2971 domain-containing protein n=1 Tax=Serratia liquefaciens TaxID=614 RepID=UPI003CFD3942
MSLIFKYRKLYDSETMELDKYTLDILMNDRIFFSKAENFNDPYDFLPTVNLTPEKIERYCNEALPVEVREGFKKAIVSTSEQEVEKVFVENFRDNFAIFCATRDHKNFLMWSHYGDNHKGICIALKTYKNTENNEALHVETDQFKKVRNRSNETYFPLFPVQYSNMRPPQFDFLGNVIDKKVPDFILTKSEVWKYEDEVRAVMLISNTDTQLVKLKKNQIAEVFIGSQVPQEIKNKLIEKLEGKSIIINEMRLSPSTYDLRTIELITKLDRESILKLIEYGIEDT